MGGPKAIIVGTNIGSTLHIPALRAAGFEIAGLVGRDAERTRGVADQHGIALTYPSLAAALHSDTDAVVIATPPETHHPMVMQAIGAGKHVFCEKPFALDPGQAREMRDAAAEAGVVGQIVHQLRWFGYARTVRELVRSGQIGRPIQGNFLFDHMLAARGLGHMPEWWVPAGRGGGWLHNFASHGIDLLRFMLGEFEEVAARLHIDTSRGMGVDDGYSFAFVMEGGMQGVMSGSARAWDACDRSRLLAEKATLSFDNNRVTLSDAEGTREARLEELGDAVDVPLPGGKDYHESHGSDYGKSEQAQMAASFRARIEDPAYSHPSVATFGDGVAHVEVIAAVMEAARGDKWVKVQRG